MAGLMWFNQFDPKFRIRHWCDQNDGLMKYGWTAHDGRNFGIHDTYETIDNGFSIRNMWLKRNGGRHGGDWTVRTSVTPFTSDHPAKFVSFLFYFASDSTGWIRSIKKTSASSVLVGETNDVGKFKATIEISQQGERKVFLNQATGNISVVHLKESLIQQGYFTKLSTKSTEMKEYVGLRPGNDRDYDDSNFVVYQVSGFAPFEFEVMFESESLREEREEKGLPGLAELKGAEFDSTLAELHGQFADKFEATFQLRAKNYSSSAILMAQSALSNMLGGISFFSGRALVKSVYGKEPVHYWPANLYTAVPSRSFFPRGFLWDEGFHNLLISQWDLEISKDIVGHWLDLMNAEGWIPREVILGDESLARVPAEFVIQNNQNANPPTLFLPLFNIIHKIHSSQENKSPRDAEYLNRVLKRLSHWYDWYNVTQIGKDPFSYRWRGRSSDTKSELNPKTLTSGLDDYPRASHPTELERHLDLRCWMAWASKVMADLSDMVKSTDKPTAYREHFQVLKVFIYFNSFKLRLIDLNLKDNELLDKLHWSGSQYADYGLHSDKVKLVRMRPMDERTPPNSMPMIRQVEIEPTYQYVNSLGYVSLFPMLLELLEPESPRLGVILDQIRDVRHLWTNYGLRSLAKSAPLYDKRNTEHDPPYWRSAIWINMNYLTLRSLKNYASLAGPNQDKAAKIYAELRQNVVNNILKNYDQTGYVWEQYDDKTGQGKGSHPFTGWSALVVLIMSEIY